MSMKSVAQEAADVAQQAIDLAKQLTGEKAQLAQPPTGITHEEQLAMQLAWANMSNVQLQIRILQSDLQQAQKLLKEKFDELAAVRDAVIKKYNIDTNTTALDNDGNFIPLTPEMRQAQMQAMMSGAMPRV